MSAPRLAALVLAGGRGSRLGGALPKPLVEIGGRPMVSHVLDRIPSSVTPVLLGANDGEAFARFQLPVVPDRAGGFRGPLAALDAAAAWLREHGDAATHLLCLPGDTPFLPADVAARLTRSLGERPHIARCGDRLHPTVAVWPLLRLGGLADHLAEGGSLSVLRFAAAADFEPVDFEPLSNGSDPFFNVNTPDDLAFARAVAEAPGI